MKISVVYEDEYLVAVNKPAGLVCHPVGGYQGNTVVSQLFNVYKKEVRLLHRLDKNTSGILLLALDSKVIPKLYKQFFRRLIQKKYLAIVRGTVFPEKGRVTLPIAKTCETSVIKLKMTTNNPEGLPAETSYEVLSQKNGYSLLLITPITGRKHQIRLHLNSIGHPIVGDYLYCREGLPFLWEYYLRRPSPWRENISGHALHAHSIEFEHPILQKKMSLVAPFPENLQKLMKGQ